MHSRLTCFGLLAALGCGLLLAAPAALADEDAYYRLLCNWSDSARESASAAPSAPVALPTGECATPAVSKAPPGLIEPDDSTEDDGDRTGRRPPEPSTPDNQREPAPPGNPSNPDETPDSVSVVDSDRELRDRFKLPAPDVAAGPGLLHGPIPQLPTVDRSPCDVPGSGCGGDTPGVTENPPVDFPPNVPGVIEPPPTTGGPGIPGFP